jgi:hypothetical protein
MPHEDVVDEGCVLVHGCFGWFDVCGSGKYLSFLTKKGFQFFVNETGFFWNQKGEKI